LSSLSRLPSTSSLPPPTSSGRFARFASDRPAQHPPRTLWSLSSHTDRRHSHSLRHVQPTPASTLRFSTSASLLHNIPTW
jgi:hypothetical protein